MTVRRVPGVRAAAFTSQLPLSGDGDLYGAHFESSTTGQKRRCCVSVCRESRLFRDDGNPAPSRPLARRERQGRLAAGGADQRVVRETQVSE